MQPTKLFIPNLTSGVAHLVGLGCLVCVLSGFYFGVFKSIQAGRDSAGMRVEIFKAKLTEASSIRTRYTASQGELERLQESVSEVKQKVPDSPNEGEFLANVSKLASQHEIQIEDFRRLDSQLETDTPHITIFIEGQGSHQGICNFLESIHHLPRIALLTQLTIDPTIDNELYPIQLKYNLYFAPPRLN